MAKSSFTDRQILSILKQAEAGTPRYSAHSGRVMDRYGGEGGASLGSAFRFRLPE